jgi:hypothetical protein
MKLARLASLLLTAVLAVGLMSASVASAAAPEFNPGTLNRFTATGGTAAIGNSLTSEVLCKSHTSTGEITGVKTVGSVLVIFHGCSSPEGGGCAVTSTGETPGLIKTEALAGELGLTKQSTSGVGLLLKPASGTKYTELEGPCLAISPAPVTGTIAGEVKTIKTKALAGTFTYVGSKGVQNITSIEILGKTEKPELLAFGAVKASFTTNGAVKYEKDIEVT